MIFDYERSAIIARKQPCPPKFCWYNALKALRHRSLDLPASTKYVEGWVKTNHGIAIEHGWLELEDGTILDPTFVAAGWEIALELGTERGTYQQHEYFPGIRYSREELKGVRLNKLPHVHDTHGFFGCDSPEYQQAMFDAQQ